MIVAHERKHAAMFRRAGEIDVTQRVAAAVDARPLAVPNGEDAVIFAFAAHLGLLRAPDGGGGEILVEARHEKDVVGVEKRLRLVHLRVDAAQRRAAIAGDEARRIQPRAPVALLLHQEQAHDRLRAGHQHAVAGKVETVREPCLAVGGAGVQGAGDVVRHSETLLRGMDARLGSELIRKTRETGVTSITRP